MRDRNDHLALRTGPTRCLRIVVDAAAGPRALPGVFGLALGQSSSFSFSSSTDLVSSTIRDRAVGWRNLCLFVYFVCFCEICFSSIH